MKQKQKETAEKMSNGGGVGEHWINNELLTAEKRIEYFEREIELARESGALEGRKEVLRKMADAGIGHYIGEGIFIVDIGELKGKHISV